MVEGTNAPLRLMLIVCGAPGTGKTTLARNLAPALGLPLIARDDLKESLFESLGWSTVEWSQRLGRATYELVYLLIERLLAARSSLLVETPFDPDWAKPRFTGIAGALSVSFGAGDAFHARRSAASALCPTGGQRRTAPGPRGSIADGSIRPCGVGTAQSPPGPGRAGPPHRHERFRCAGFRRSGEAVSQHRRNLTANWLYSASWQL